ncbi:unnamed protein product [Allacma fusca]|uniref:Uncharacterized protein n=1 Tax=Allacma fusca TaxID=39272 RepID=A0A8J2KEF5_9HEXA|nr:unnamed protein product [Allacma fusca]
MGKPVGFLTRRLDSLTRRKSVCNQRVSADELRADDEVAAMMGNRRWGVETSVCMCTLPLSVDSLQVSATREQSSSHLLFWLIVPTT